MTQTPDSDNPYHTSANSNAEPPLASGQPASPQDTGDGTGGVIPYKNMPALLAYYFAVFSLIPCIGVLLGIPAVVLGFIGLQRYKANPVVRGTAHAWIGIILGGCMSLLWIGLILLAVIGGAMANSGG